MSKKDDEEALLLLFLHSVEKRVPFEPTRTKAGRRLIKRVNASSPTYTFRKHHAHVHGATVTTTLPGKPIKEMPIDGFNRAMFEYTYLVFMDPTNFPEAAGWSTALGVSYKMGMLVTLAKGLAIVPIITAVDPQDRWEGGLDETRLYQSIESDITYGAGLGWAASPANPANMPDYTHRFKDLDYSGGYIYSGLY